MERRTLLRRSAALGAFALAGCLANGDDGDPDDGDGTGTPPPADGGGGDAPADSPTDAPTDSPTDASTPSAPSGIAGTSIETSDTGCAGSDAPTASVGFDDEGIAVTVDGVLRAADPCHVASLERTRYHADTTVLEIVVTAEPEEGERMCVQCIGAVDYETVVDLEGGLPGTVVVQHGTGEDATEVARVSRD